MKKIMGLLAILLLVNSCAPVLVADSKPEKRPPGQMKKVTGSQSAKPFAPGQQKRKQ